ncbi:MAG: DinB family protein, partial [Chitinophagaceae bacterium]
MLFNIQWLCLWFFLPKPWCRQRFCTTSPGSFVKNPPVMAKFKTEDLLQQLRTDVERIRSAAAFFKEADKNKLTYSPSPDKWSVVQILEHLNAYGRYYLPAMRKAMTDKVTHK